MIKRSVIDVVVSNFDKKMANKMFFNLYIHRYFMFLFVLHGLPPCIMNATDSNTDAVCATIGTNCGNESSSLNESSTSSENLLSDCEF
mmetsp:Transcript_12210/g.16948  ORF Transcript_12210/g.16948 Transcript_12210/m.16948 type:complete len:88 (-) Transcript_12210:745-1008(-)